MNKQIYKFKSYKDYINALVFNSTNNGRGQYRKMAICLNVSSVTISQIFRGMRELSLEQGLMLADYWVLSEYQKKYLLLMIQKEKSSQYQFVKYCEEEMLKLQQELEEIKTRVPKSKSISEKEKSIFYSHWKYSAIRLFTDIEEKNSISDIANKLNLAPNDVKQVLDFLVSNALVVETPAGYKIGPQATHLPATSPWLRQHHRNWRTKALEGLEDLDRNELSYTAPMAISEESLGEIREVLLETIEKIIPIIKKSKSERLACLNIDLFKFPKIIYRS
jgi:uncharacterized protein (TIGR02147 family)